MNLLPLLIRNCKGSGLRGSSRSHPKEAEELYMDIKKDGSLDKVTSFQMWVM